MDSHAKSLTIVGASATGFGVAQQVRRMDPDIAIELIGDEASEPYDRPPLSKHVLDGRWEPERAALPGLDELRSTGATITLGTAATALDPQSKRLMLADGTHRDFDQLVIATGVRARIPAAWADIPGVHTLRTLEDALALRRRLLDGGDFVIIGAGFIGLEFAAAARSFGCRVEVVEAFELPLIAKLGPRLGARVARLHEDHGVRFHLGSGVEELVIGNDGSVVGVRLTNGTVLASTTVVVGIGTLPNTEWLVSSGLAVSNGVQCDRQLRVAEGVFAAGDVAAVWNDAAGAFERYEHRANVGPHTNVIAHNVLGGAMDLSTVPFFWTDQYDVKIQVVGDPRESHQTEVVSGSIDDNHFLAVYRDDGAVRAALGWNMPKELMKYRVELASTHERMAG